MKYEEGQRVRFDGWDNYPPKMSAGTVRFVLKLREPEHPFAAPICVRWDTGGEGFYSEAMLLPENKPAIERTGR